jgi:hypothetical protein
MLMCSVMSYVVSLMGMVPRQSVKSRRQLLKISVLALVFGFTVVGGNISLRFLPVSFNQAVGATTPFFTAIFSAAILGAPPSPMHACACRVRLRVETVWVSIYSSDAGRIGGATRCTAQGRSRAPTRT